MLITCCISFLAAMLSMSLLIFLHIQHYHFSKNAVLLQGEVVGVVTQQKQDLKAENDKQKPMVEYSFQNKRWCYVANLDVAKEKIVIGRRLNLRVLLNQPSVVRSDLELIKRDHWIMIFSSLFLLFIIIAVTFLNLNSLHTSQMQASTYWVITIAVTCSTVWMAKMLFRLKSGQDMENNLMYSNAQVVSEKPQEQFPPQAKI